MENPRAHFILLIDYKPYYVHSVERLASPDFSIERGNPSDIDVRRAWKYYAHSMVDRLPYMITIRASIHTGLVPEDDVPTRVSTNWEKAPIPIVFASSGPSSITKCRNHRALEVTVRPATSQEEANQRIVTKGEKQPARTVEVTEEKFTEVRVNGKLVATIQRSDLIRAILRKLWSAYQRPKRKDHFLNWEKLIADFEPLRGRKEPAQILERYSFKQWLEIRPGKSGHRIALKE